VDASIWLGLVCAALILVGLAGTALPALPGTVLVGVLTEPSARSWAPQGVLYSLAPRLAVPESFEKEGIKR
jgi:uncharacterized protein YqgC (DUF456 family)